MRAILLALVLIGLAGAAPAVAQQPVGGFERDRLQRPDAVSLHRVRGDGLQKVLQGRARRMADRPDHGRGVLQIRNIERSAVGEAQAMARGPLNETVLVDVRCGSAVAVQRPVAARAAPRLATRPQIEVYEEPEPLVERSVERPVAAPTQKKRTLRREYPPSSTEAAFDDAALDDAKPPVRGLRDDGPPQRFRNRRPASPAEPQQAAERSKPSKPARPVAAKPEDNPKPQPAKAAPPEPEDRSISYEHF